MRRPVFLAIWLVVMSLWSCSRHDRVFRTHADVPELSGLVESRRYKGVYWAHGDSGNAPALYAIDKKGKPVARFPVAADNEDWEDITRDDQGHLYIADTGNNFNVRKDLVVYVIDEPDPRSRVRTLSPRARLFFRYPDQQDFPDFKRRFDAEAIFFAQGRLYLLTKRETDTFTTLYRFTRLTDGPMQTLERIGDAELRVDSGQEHALVTSADASPDGTEVAVLTYQNVYRYAFSEQRGLTERLWWKRFAVHGDAEALAWVDEGLLIGHEDGYLQRLRRLHFKNVMR